MEGYSITHCDIVLYGSTASLWSAERAKPPFPYLYKGHEETADRRLPIGPKTSTEVLYVTELIDVVIIGMGYRWNIRAPVPAKSRAGLASPAPSPGVGVFFMDRFWLPVRLVATGRRVPACS